MTTADQERQDGFRPALVTQIELTEALPDIGKTDQQTTAYAHAMVLVRIHGEPLGIIDLELDEGRIAAEQYAPLVWKTFSDGANRHLEADGFGCLQELPTRGLKAPRAGAACDKAQQAALNRAPMASVIIATRERAEQLERCLESFEKVQYPHFEVLVVDNNSKTSATADLVQRLRSGLPMLRYIRDDRQGISWAHNRGIEEARGQIIAFTDDDVVVDPGWLIELVRGFELGEKVACVTGPLVPMELETEAQELFERYDGFNRGYEPIIFDMGEHRMNNVFYPFSVGHCGTGASMAFTREAVHGICRPDPALGVGSKALAGDDLDRFYQVIVHGYQLVYTPASIAFHQHRRGYAELRRQVYAYGVGLTAYLTKCLLTDVRRIPGFLARIPAGIYNMLASRSSLNTARGPSFPDELSRVEWMGMLYGPIAYLRARADLRNGKSPAPEAAAEAV